jgi:hypothetical protein
MTSWLKALEEERQKHKEQIKEWEFVAPSGVRRELLWHCG